MKFNLLKVIMMPTIIKGQPTSEQVLKQLANEGKPVLLSFSCGKDSIACWLALKEHNIDVVPVYMYAPPGMPFIEKEIKYFENFFGCKIHQYPHKTFWAKLDCGLFQPPQRIPALIGLGFYSISYEELWSKIKDDLDLPQETWICDGVRASDSIVRRASFVKHGVMKKHLTKCSPIADYLKAEVMEIIKKHGCELPVDYKWFGRSFDGLDYRFIKPLKENSPKDFEYLKMWFPLIGTDLVRHEAYEF